MFSTRQAVKSGVPRSLTLTLIHCTSSEILLRKEKVKKNKIPLGKGKCIDFDK